MLSCLVSFVNFQNPVPPKEAFPSSLLHNVSWPKWGTSLDKPPVFLFSDTPDEAYQLVEDTYRKASMEVLSQAQVQLGV